ncbi:hypothetical protein, partial [Saccharothrix sp. ST-888]|uniref:hypothetical protein n=1 Tax=Saccharothrix sp. ST-888 TaxID=1427391 RepID=UPI001E560557
MSISQTFVRLLGVKGSQVQILSSRLGFAPLSQVRGRFLVREEAAFGVRWGCLSHSSHGFHGPT